MQKHFDEQHANHSQQFVLVGFDDVLDIIGVAADEIAEIKFPFVQDATDFLLADGQKLADGGDLFEAVDVFGIKDDDFLEATGIKLFADEIKNGVSFL